MLLEFHNLGELIVVHLFGAADSATEIIDGHPLRLLQTSSL